MLVTQSKKLGLTPPSARRSLPASGVQFCSIAPPSALEHEREHAAMLQNRNAGVNICIQV